MQGHQLFVHGGIADDDEYLNDGAVYAIMLQKWYPLTILEDTPGPTVAHHTCCLILPNEQRFNPKLNLYKLPDMRVSRRGEIKVSLNIYYP